MLVLVGMLQPSLHMLLLARNPWPCLLVCWLQVLNLLAQQHWFCLWAVDVRFPFLLSLLDKEAIGVLSVAAAAVPEARVLEVQGGELSGAAPGGCSSPLDGFLAESPSHTHRHCSGLVWVRRELLVLWGWGKMWVSAVTPSSTVCSG